MKNILILLLGAGFLFFGCTSKEDAADHKKPAAERLTQLVLDAVNGNESANDSLSDLFDYSMPQPGDLNNLIIDSLTLLSGKIYYFLLVEHNNPVYNRFAVYDSALNVYLVDKSLNGNLSLSKNDTIAPHLVSIKEEFVSKDTLKLERLSLYNLDDSSVVLVLRTYLKLNMPRTAHTQNIEEISEDRIKTSIKSSRSSIINNKGDVFLYNESARAYLSQQDIFHKFVINEIKNFNIVTKKPEITDEQSALNSVGITPGSDTITFTGNTNNKMGFYLTLDEGWKELNKIGITEHLKRKFTGTRYLNSTIGATISVVQLAPEDSAEMYINYNLTTLGEIKYKVRNSEKIETGKDFVQFFEFSCGTKKYLMIFEASKYTYEKYKQMYVDIINSFNMDC
ncbi:MAG: hypothetical protein R6W90_13590 [Ignavibacteriaceae bacterium]